MDAEYSVEKVRVKVRLDTGFMAYTVLYTHETPFNSKSDVLAKRIQIFKLKSCSSSWGCV